MQCWTKGPGHTTPGAKGGSALHSVPVPAAEPTVQSAAVTPELAGDTTMAPARRPELV